jgi:hypothetical protein
MALPTNVVAWSVLGCEQFVRQVGNVAAPDSFGVCCQVLFLAFLQAITLCTAMFPITS